MPLIGFALTAGLMAALTHGGEMSVVFYAVPIYRLPEFVLGMAAFVLFIERQQPARLLFFSGATSALMGLLLIYFAGNLPGNIEYGGFFFLGFLSLFVMATRVKRLPGHLARLFNWLGHISYCVYIVQFGTVPLFKSYLEGASTEYQWVVFIGTNLALAVITFYLVERVMHKPVLSLLSDIVLKRRKKIQVLR